MAACKGNGIMAVRLSGYRDTGFKMGLSTIIEKGGA